MSNLVWIERFIYSRPQYNDLSYMGNTGPCTPMRIIFGSGIQSWYRRLIIKFGANRTSHVPKIPVYRFGLYGRYQILFTDIANRSLFAKFEVRSSLRSNAIMITTVERTDRHTWLKCLRISRWSNVSKEARVLDQYFYASHTYWQN